MTVGLEVFLLDPLPAFVGVASPTPPPQQPIDAVVHAGEGALTRGTSVVHRPALDLLIQTLDELPGCLLPRSLQGCPDLAQERLYTALGGSQQHDPTRVAAYRLPQEVEAGSDMR